jgi:hypothetical protein
LELCCLGQGSEQLTKGRVVAVCKKRLNVHCKRSQTAARLGQQKCRSTPEHRASLWMDIRVQLSLIMSGGTFLARAHSLTRASISCRITCLDKNKRWLTFYDFVLTTSCSWEAQGEFKMQCWAERRTMYGSVWLTCNKPLSCKTKAYKVYNCT